MGSDAGDDYLTRMAIPTMNGSYTASAHDVWDDMDQYEIYVPENYGMLVTLGYPTDTYMSLTLGDNASYDVISEYDEGEYPQEAYSLFADGGDTFVITVEMLRGSGEYTIDIDMLWPNNTLNPENDCGTGFDFNHFTRGPQAPWNTNWVNHSGMDDPTTSDIGPTGGTCTAWMDAAWDPEDNVRVSIPEDHFMNVTLTTLTDLNDEDTGFSIQEDFLASRSSPAPTSTRSAGPTSTTRSPVSASWRTRARARPDDRLRAPRRRARPPALLHRPVRQRTDDRGARVRDLDRVHTRRRPWFPTDDAGSGLGRLCCHPLWPQRHRAHRGHRRRCDLDVQLDHRRARVTELDRVGVCRQRHGRHLRVPRATGILLRDLPNLGRPELLRVRLQHHDEALRMGRRLHGVPVYVRQLVHDASRNRLWLDMHRELQQRRLRRRLGQDELLPRERLLRQRGLAIER